MADGTFADKDYTKVNFSAARDITTEWTATVNEYVATYMKAAEDPNFKLLEELGFSDGFPAKFDGAMEGYQNEINSVITALNAYFDELQAEDSNMAGLVPKRRNNGSGGGGGGGRRGDNTGTNPTSEPDSEPEEVGIDNAEEQAKFFENISMSDLSEVLSALNTVFSVNGRS